MKLDIFYSYACRDSYLTFAWLQQVQQQIPTLLIKWHPFAIQIDNASEYWARSWESANSELRGFIAAEAARQQGAEAFQRFHAALEVAVHEQFRELGDQRTLLDVAQQVKLEVDGFQTAWRDPELVRKIHKRHQEAIRKFSVFGTPTLVFPNNRAYHVELTRVPPEANALETFHTIETLATKQPYLQQLRWANITL